MIQKRDIIFGPNVGRIELEYVATVEAGTQLAVLPGGRVVVLEPTKPPQWLTPKGLEAIKL